MYKVEIDYERTTEFEIYIVIMDDSIRTDIVYSVSGDICKSYGQVIDNQKVIDFIKRINEYSGEELPIPLVLYGYYMEVSIGYTRLQTIEAIGRLQTSADGCINYIRLTTPPEKSDEPMYTGIYELNCELESGEYLIRLMRYNSTHEIRERGVYLPVYSVEYLSQILVYNLVNTQDTIHTKSILRDIKDFCHEHANLNCPNHRVSSHVQLTFDDFVEVSHDDKYHTVQHLNCGYNYKLSKYNFDCNRYGVCPNCGANDVSLNRLSNGEHLIREYLLNKSYIFTMEHSFKGLNDGLVDSNVLRYDFAVKLKSGKILLLEYQGQQHCKFVQHFFKTEDRFEKQIKNDKLKYDYAKSHGYYYLTIPYTLKASQVKEILDYYLERAENGDSRWFLLQLPIIYMLELKYSYSKEWILTKDTLDFVDSVGKNVVVNGKSIMSIRDYRNSRR